MITAKVVVCQKFLSGYDVFVHVKNKEAGEEDCEEIGSSSSYCGALEMAFREVKELIANPDVFVDTEVRVFNYSPHTIIECIEPLYAH